MDQSLVTSSLPAATGLKWQRGRYRSFARFMRLKLAVFGSAIILMTAFGAVTAPVLAPHGPTEFVGRPAEPPFSTSRVLGTDNLGRDQLTRLMYGARASLRVSIVAVGVAATVGAILGLVAAYFRGIIDAIFMRIVDAVLSLPGLVLPLSLLAVFGGGINTVSFALAVAFIPSHARLMRGQALGQLGRDYTMAARSLGAGDWRIMLKHVAPNCLAPIIVQSSLQMSVAVIAEAGLGFLGVGVTPPTPTWGNMLSTGFGSIRSEPWLVYVPAAAIFLLVLSFNFVGDALRDLLDPRLRGVLDAQL